MLAGGQLGPDEARRVERHLAGCAECRSAYAEAIDLEMAHRRGDVEPPSETLRRAAYAVGVEHSRRRRGEGGRGTRRPWGLPALAAAAVLLVAGLGVVTSLTQRGTPRRHDLDPILKSIGEASARGLVLPGGEDWADRPVEEFRGNGPTGTGFDTLADAALRGLAGRGSVDDAVLALSGYVARGRLQIAGTYARSARQRFPDDARLLVLEGVVAYRQGEITRAEELLRQAIVEDPGNIVARLDLAMVLLDRQAHSQAREHLEFVIRNARHSAMERRARRLLDTGVSSP